MLMSLMSALRSFEGFLFYIRALLTSCCHAAPPGASEPCKTEHLTPGCAAGWSPFPGNINQLVLKLASYEP
jgi:hypothetical protein